MTYEEAVQELYYSLYGSYPSNFHTLLYDLIKKADPVNKERLRLAYPMELEVFEEWQMARDQSEFFARWGLKVWK